RQRGADTFAPRSVIIIAHPARQLQHVALNDGRLVNQLFDLADVLSGDFALWTVVQADDKPGDELFIKRHDDPTADLCAARQFTHELISEGLADEDWDGDFCEHRQHSTR